MGGARGWELGQRHDPGWGRWWEGLEAEAELGQETEERDARARWSGKRKMRAREGGTAGVELRAGTHPTVPPPHHPTTPPRAEIPFTFLSATLSG